LTITAADGRKINVARSGQGSEVLMLLHGFGENHRAWGLLPAEVAPAYTVFAVDLRGHGDSDWDPNPRYPMQGLVADMLTIIDRLKLGTLGLAGHSMGADIALQVSALRPLQVKKLMLVEFSLEAVSNDVLDFTLAQFKAQFRLYASVDEYQELLQQQRPL